ncbi:MAG: general secretion pathway protein GspB [Xanthomonadales bacterium]|nr:general secretion pathway protein GspB [Xanthomonadales bacterium]
MSLILEALRKSEAERRRGLAPDVAMELPPVPAARTRANPAWAWPVVAGVLLAVGATGWWKLRDDRASAPSAGMALATGATEKTDATPAAPMVVRRQVPAPAASVSGASSPSAPPAPPASSHGIAASAAPIAPAAPPPRPAPTPAPAAMAADVPDLDATGLPPVKLTMHMWDEAPARRFVILDGQRMAEGDRSGGLSVVEIRRDGVVVERDGQRARVPLP